MGGGGAEDEAESPKPTLHFTSLPLIVGKPSTCSPFLLRDFIHSEGIN